MSLILREVGTNSTGALNDGGVTIYERNLPATSVQFQEYDEEDQMVI